MAPRPPTGWLTWGDVPTFRAIMWAVALGRSQFPSDGRVLDMFLSNGFAILKLDSTGAIQCQNAYNGGVYCFFNGYSESCADIGAVTYSLHQAPDGGYLPQGMAT